jgi:hypothetical protein
MDPQTTDSIDHERDGEPDPEGKGYPMGGPSPPPVAVAITAAGAHFETTRRTAALPIVDLLKHSQPSTPLGNLVPSQPTVNGSTRRKKTCDRAAGSVRTFHFARWDLASLLCGIPGP